MKLDTTIDWRYWLFEWVDEFRRTHDPSLLAAPAEGLTAELRALQAAVAETLATETGLPLPLWCDGVGTLPEPWFVAGMESLKASALVESPLPFRRRNIFVLANFLSRL
jgi:hypothetical protein